MTEEAGGRGWLLHLTDEEVEQKIHGLTGMQRRKFEEAMVHTGNRRRSLLVARSYPIDMKEKS